MAVSKTYYDILQVQPNATQEVIDAAHRALAKIYHPDVSREPDADRLMQEINHAHDVLSDPEKRRDYDRSIGLNRSGSSRASQSPTPSNERQSQAAKTRASEQPQRQSAPARPTRISARAVDCPYFFGDYHRGRDIEKCRLIERNRENTRPWKRALCDTCPVPGIVRRTTCKHLALEGSVVKKLLVMERVEVYAICTEHVLELADPNHCPQCEAESNG